MCRPSVVADDWVVKGCHIHVNGVELAVRPDHHGRIVFRRVFASTPNDAFQAAVRTAEQVCLPGPAVRVRWRRDLERAILYVRTYQGELAELANGRQLEFRFLLLALQRWENHGNA
jgi:hypothetical protein